MRMPPDRFPGVHSSAAVHFGSAESLRERRCLHPAAVVMRPAMAALKLLLGRIFLTGTVTVYGPDGENFVVGDGAPKLAIRIARPDVVLGLLFRPDLVLGEAYMDGSLTVEGGDIHDFLELSFANVGWSRPRGLKRMLAYVRRVAHRATECNPIPIARSNVAHHYDLSDALYDLFLEGERQYSCAYFVSPTDTLEQAQQQKMRHLAAKLLLRRGQRVLDIGSGWGGLAMYIAETAEADVTGITLSTEQHRYAQHLADALRPKRRVRFELRDYRQERGRYDRIVSVGMFEHVGVRHYREYFEKIADLLVDDGVALVHTIGRLDGPGAANPWIKRYIFPGGYVPALSEMIPAVERAGLCVTDVEVLRLHYAETLKAWRERFSANRARVAQSYDDRFCRMWEFYLAGCEAAFRHGGLVVFQVQLAKRLDSVPLTRHYIERHENGIGTI